MLLVLRILFYVQFLLGLGRLAGLVSNQRIWETHVTLGVLIAALALVALRPRPETPSGLVTAARLMPLLPLATGLAMYADVAGGRAFTLLHVALAVAALGLIEAASARLRKATSDGKAG